MSDTQLLTEAEIRAAVLKTYSNTKCFDLRPITYMTISAITPMNAYRYILETVIETRTISSKSVPYRGQVLPPNKPCPDKWSLSVPPPHSDLPSNALVEFKETSIIMACPTCQGSGRSVCIQCAGRGFHMCYHCGGRGVARDYFMGGRSYTGIGLPCRVCGGGGRLPCGPCGSTGWVTCSICEGQCSVVFWNTLIVKWVKDVKTFNNDRGALSYDLLAKCAYSGMEESRISTPEDPRPLEFPNDPGITEIAETSISSWMAKKEDFKILSFTQTVLAVPVVEVDFRWKGHVDKFYVYGADQQVHFPVKYPGSGCGCMCCCGNSSCSIV